MKVCRTCAIERPESEYDVRRETGRLRNDCKFCRRAAVSRYRRENYERVIADTRMRRQRVREFLVAEKESKPCADCKCWYPHYVMDFHHVTGKKEMLVSRACSAGAALEKVQAEIDKCVLLCANCHRLRHGAARTAA